MTDKNTNKNKNAPVEPFMRRHRPFFVALFVLIPALAIPALLFFTVIKSDVFQKWHTLHVVYENSQGLKKGSPVSMSGTTVGHVKSIDLIKEKAVHVDFGVNARYTRLVKKDTRARVKQKGGFMGEWEIELYGGSAEALTAEDGDTLRPERVLSIDDIIEAAGAVVDTAAALLNDVTKLVKGISAGEGTVGRLFTDDTLYRRLDQVSANVAGLTSSAHGLTSDARGLTADVRGLLDADVRGTVRKADSLLTALSGVSATVSESGAALFDSLKTLVNNANQSFEGVEAILKNLKTVSETAPGLMDRIKDDLEEVELLMQSLQKNWLFKKAAGGGDGRNPSLLENP